MGKTKENICFSVKKYFYFFLISFFLILDYFDILILKINKKNKKNIILIHFQTKNTLTRVNV
jgi:hypothetical protein